MNPFCFYLLPLGGILFASSILVIFLAWFKYRLNKIIKNSDLFFEEQLMKILVDQTGQLEGKISEFIDKRLEDVIIEFKQLIPMASLFLGSTQENKLKDHARLIFIKMIPEITEIIREKGKSQEIKQKLKGCIENQYKSFRESFYRSDLLLIFGIAGSLGLLFGSIEALAIFFLC